MMHAKAHVDVLSSMVKRVRGAITKKDDQRYGRVELKCYGGNFFIYAGEADYYTVISTQNVEVIQDGRVVLPADKFFAVVGSGLKGSVEMISEGNSFILKCGRSRFRLPTYGELAIVPPDDVPLESYALCNEFVSRMKLCGKIVNNDHYPFAHVQGSCISATDGLSAMRIEFSGDVKEPCVFSKRGVAEIPSALKGMADDAYAWMGQSEAWTFIVVDDQRIWVRKTSHSFPDLSDLFGRSINNGFVIKLEDLKSAVKRVSSAIGTEAVLHVEQKDEMAQFNVVDMDGSLAWDSVPAEFTGSIGKFRTSLNEFSHCVSNISQESVRVDVGDREVRFVTDFGLLVISKVA